MPTLVAFAEEAVDVGIDLGLQRLGQHPAGTRTDDLVNQRRRSRRVVTVGGIRDYGEHRVVPSQPALPAGLAWNLHSVTREGTPPPESIHRFQALLPRELDVARVQRWCAARVPMHATKSASNARSPHDTSRSSSGVPPGARTSGPSFRSPACVTPPPTSPGPCTGATATFASTSTSQWLPHTESKTSSPSSTGIPPASSGANYQLRHQTAHLPPLRWGQLQPSRRGQFRLTSPATRTGRPLPFNHSPQFAPAIEPTLTTGVNALALSSRSAHLARNQRITSTRRLGQPLAKLSPDRAADPIECDDIASVRSLLKRCVTVLHDLAMPADDIADRILVTYTSGRTLASKTALTKTPTERTDPSSPWS